MPPCVFSRLYRIKPIADAIEDAGMGGWREWENTTGWHFNGAGFSNLLIKWQFL